MKKILLALIIFSSPIFAKGFNDGSKMGTPEMAKCAAAALKIELELWKKWQSAVQDRYSIIYKESKSPEEIEAYTYERIMDKKRALQRQGYDSKKAFQKYFSLNCEGEI